MKLLITGGAGFIGSALIRYLIHNTNHKIINVDKLTYAGNLSSLDTVSGSNRYVLERVDVCCDLEVSRLFSDYRPDAILHLAAESHVDRSIYGGSPEFVRTNVVGTHVMLMHSLKYYESLDSESKEQFRFLHVSTDEVFGDLNIGSHGLFSEDSPYNPSSPYSASKAASDHLVRAWARTYGFPALVSNCSNNYGFFQFPEKLIPRVIISALQGKSIPVYGQGDHIRDWLYVDDHIKALVMLLDSGRIGESYNIGGSTTVSNIEIVEAICSLLQEYAPSFGYEEADYRSQIRFVEDRPGHDRRYAVDTTKICSELNWEPVETLDSGLRKTVVWYLSNKEWWNTVL